MSNEQLYLAVGVPIVMNMLFNGVMFLVLNKRIEDMRDLVRAEIRASVAEIKTDIARLDQRVARLEDRAPAIVSPR